MLARLGAAVAEHVEQLRNVQMQNLVSQAELKALQAQINPHFLFNSLNTLYGTIDRGNTEARRLVLNLADVYRYLLRSERTLVEVEEELRIVRAYLEIEELRLGPKLRTEVDADPPALHATIPLLSIQPLVENAVKHGVASRMGAGFVHLKIRRTGEAVSVEVSNSGDVGLSRPVVHATLLRDRFDQRPPPAGVVLRPASALRYSRGERCHHRRFRAPPADGARSCAAVSTEAVATLMSPKKLSSPLTRNSQSRSIALDRPLIRKESHDAVSPCATSGLRSWRSGMGLKTLIVDDEPVARKVLREELESIAGVEVVGEADNGVAALDHDRRQRPDLVLLDLQMPEMGGFEVIRKIRHGTHLPVIVIVTAYDKYALEAFEAGAIDYC